MAINATKQGERINCFYRSPDTDTDKIIFSQSLEVHVPTVIYTCAQYVTHLSWHTHCLFLHVTTQTCSLDRSINWSDVQDGWFAQSQKQRKGGSTGGRTRKKNLVYNWWTNENGQTCSDKIVPNKAPQMIIKIMRTHVRCSLNLKTMPANSLQTLGHCNSCHVCVLLSQSTIRITLCPNTVIYFKCS